MIKALGDPVDEIVDFVVEVGLEFPALSIAKGGGADVVGLGFDIVEELVFVARESLHVDFFDAGLKFGEGEKIVDDG